MKQLAASLLVCLSLVGCGHSTTSTAMPGMADSGPYRPIGEVQYQGQGASFSETRVVGPNIDVSRRSDGTWGGRIEGHPVSLNPYRNRVAGVDLNLNLDNRENGQIVTGQWRGQILRFEVRPDVILIRSASRSFTLPAVGAGAYGGAQGDLRLSGEAAVFQPPFPQFALAMVGAFITTGPSMTTGRPGEAYQPGRR